MSRASEFSNKIRIAAFKRCGGKCENASCGAKLKVGEGEYDHIIALALGGESSLENCQILCVPCHRGKGAKTAKDVADIARAKRRELKHSGAAAPKQPIPSRGFSAPAKPPRQSKDLPPLPYRALYAPKEETR
jgi:hypothetical protein